MRPTRILRTAGFRLAALHACLFGLSALVLFAIIYWTSSDALRQQIASNIRDEVTALIAEYKDSGLKGATTDIRQRLASGLHPTSYYLLLDPKGHKLAGNLDAAHAPKAGWLRLPFPPGKDEVPNDGSSDSTERRLLAYGQPLDDGALLVVGEDIYRLTELEEAITQAFVWAFGVTIVLGVAGGVILSYGFLRRVDDINRTSRAIIQGSLTDRVPTRGTGDELDRLAVNLNEMLDRIQGLIQTLQQVSNDIAHDLRTPLSRLRQRLEGARMNARSMADYDAAIEQAVEDTDSILKTFAALLRIAQIEAGTRQAAFADVDLSAVFQAIGDAYEAVAEDRGQTLAMAIAPDVRVLGDRELLTQMLANLIENAMQHTPEGTRIELALAQRPAGPLGVVADDGPGIPEDAREKVFRRFYRLERSRSTPGNGLGLSLVAAVAELHGIAITLADNAPGLRVELDFAPDEPARPAGTARS